MARVIGALAIAGATGAALLTGSGAASAATLPGCGAPRPVNVDSGWGVMGGSFNLKTAPYAKCGNVTRVHAGQVLYFHCWTRNEYGRHWVYVRVKGTGTHGWMSKDNLRTIRNTQRQACGGEDHRDYR
ncbi:hypothetical protein [Nonomuraea sp. SYSU D8015]|uniref:hypothetical protein n=1 Tax=Nonomuraea sp. SYSU D8015 TaxID=2593644 RepID=UPI0016613585|nr:hypothetical protein [Nonomuraea sp. SYSU D8015]